MRLEVELGHITTAGEMTMRDAKGCPVTVGVGGPVVGTVKSVSVKNSIVYAELEVTEGTFVIQFPKRLGAVSAGVREPARKISRR
jgi:hypothetical protein